jgi:hypothetical protein
MSLYTYVPSKAELDGPDVRPRAGRHGRPGRQRRGLARAGLAFIARQRWALVELHPWFLTWRCIARRWGPTCCRKVDVMLGALGATGLHEEEMALVAEALQNYVTGAQQSARDARDAEAQSGLTDEQWIDLLRPQLRQHVDAEAYPALARRKAPAGPDARSRRTSARRASSSGLERVLGRAGGLYRQATRAA